AKGRRRDDRAASVQPKQAAHARSAKVKPLHATLARRALLRLASMAAPDPHSLAVWPLSAIGISTRPIGAGSEQKHLSSGRRLRRCGISISHITAVACRAADHRRESAAHVGFAPKTWSCPAANVPTT